MNELPSGALTRRFLVLCEQYGMVRSVWRSRLSPWAGAPAWRGCPTATTGTHGTPARCTLLVEAQQQGRLARKLAQLARFDLVICDELGYVPLDKAGADLLFGFISQRYERRSLVVTTNLPFTRWSEVFLDPTAAAAVIDRVVHHATVLQTTGGSFRLAAAKQNQAPAAGKKGAR